MASSKRKEDADAELEELDVREVSIVDRPANKRRFLIVKRDSAGNPEEDMPNTVEVIKDEDSLLDLLGLGDDAGDSDITDDEVTVTLEDDFNLVEAITKAAVDAAAKVVGASVGKLSKIVSALKAEKAEVPDSVISDIKTVAEMLMTLADKLGEGGGAGGDEQMSDDKEKAKKADAAPLLRAASTALQRLMAVAEKLKSIDKAGEVPSAIISELKAVGALLQKVVGGADKPEAGAADAGGDKDDPKDAKKDPPGGKKDPTELQDKEKATKRLQVFVTKSDDEDPEIIIKAGAKMKRARLNQFKKAVETLMSLLKELEGDQGGADKDAKDKKGVTKSDTSDLNEKLVKGFELLESKLAEKIAEALEPITKRIDEIDSTVPPGNGDADATETKPEAVKKNEGLWSNIFR